MAHGGVIISHWPRKRWFHVNLIGHAANKLNPLNMPLGTLSGIIKRWGSGVRMGKSLLQVAGTALMGEKQKLNSTTGYISSYQSD